MRSAIGVVAAGLAIGRADRDVVDRFEERLGRSVPATVRELLAHDGLVEALAPAYDAHPGLPAGRLVTSAEMPGLDGDVLWLMSENQGVCVWGVPLDAGADPPVLVGGELSGEGTGPMRYADDVATFVASWAWDRSVLERSPLVQAWSPPLAAEDEAFLAGRFEQGPTTWGWPCRRNLRFESPAGAGILLWACGEETTWMISAPDPTATEDCVSDLRTRFDLQPLVY